MLYVIQAPAAANGRAVVMGRVSLFGSHSGVSLITLSQWYTQAGKLIAVCTQEGVVRAAPPIESTAQKVAKAVKAKL
jgi:acyl-CoA thioesterase